MELGEWRKLALERSFAPIRADAASWREHYDRDPVRLWARCRHEGHQPWLLTYNVPAADPR